MIPKIIHYVWLGNAPYPDKVVACMKSWKKYLPDYELHLWNAETFDIKSSLWVSHAIDAKCFAFAADYIRLYALYNYGGIYLDTDVEVLKSFDDLLDLPYFMGDEYEEQFQHYKIDVGTLGAEKGAFWIEKMLDYYQKREFFFGFGHYDMKPMPMILREVLEENYALKWVNTPAEISRNEQEVCVLPVDYFSPKSWKTGELINQTERTYTIHHFKMSWVKKRTLWQFAVDLMKLTIPYIIVRANNYLSLRILRKNKQTKTR